MLKRVVSNTITKSINIDYFNKSVIIKSNKKKGSDAVEKNS